MIDHHAEVIFNAITLSHNNCRQNYEGQCLKKVKKVISRIPDRDLKFPESGIFSSGPDKSGIGKPELAIPISRTGIVTKEKRRNGELLAPKCK